MKLIAITMGNEKSMLKMLVIIPALVLILGCFSSPDNTDASENDSSERKTFDHSIFNLLLKTYVKDGAVDYQGLKEDEAKLDDYLAKLVTAEVNRLTRNEKLALFINAYNAFTLKLILNYYPNIHSIKDISSSKRWKDKRWNIGGRKISLNDLEHKILRAQFGDPRIHFAIVCASVSCPNLANYAYRGDIIEEQLEKAAKNFFTSSKHVKVAAEPGRIWGTNYNLYVSSILKWFSKDFGKTKDSIIKYVERYANEEVRKFIQAHRDKLNLKYLNYDWSLNDKRNEKHYE